MIAWCTCFVIIEEAYKQKFVSLATHAPNGSPTNMLKSILYPHCIAVHPAWKTRIDKLILPPDRGLPGWASLDSWGWCWQGHYAWYQKSGISRTFCNFNFSNLFVLNSKNIFIKKFNSLLCGIGRPTSTILISLSSIEIFAELLTF